jgi:hypothetical protein
VSSFVVTGTGTETFTIEHSLATTDVITVVYNTTTGDVVLIEVQVIDNASVDFVFTDADAATYKCIVFA